MEKNKIEELLKLLEFPKLFYKFPSLLGLILPELIDIYKIQENETFMEKNQIYLKEASKKTIKLLKDLEPRYEDIDSPEILYQIGNLAQIFQVSSILRTIRNLIIKKGSFEYIGDLNTERLENNLSIGIIQRLFVEKKQCFGLSYNINELKNLKSIIEDKKYILNYQQIIFFIDKNLPFSLIEEIVKNIEFIENKNIYVLNKLIIELEKKHPAIIEYILKYYNELDIISHSIALKWYLITNVEEKIKWIKNLLNRNYYKKLIVIKRNEIGYNIFKESENLKIYKRNLYIELINSLFLKNRKEELKNAIEEYYMEFGKIEGFLTDIWPFINYIDIENLKLNQNLNESSFSDLFIKYCLNNLDFYQMQILNLEERSSWEFGIKCAIKATKLKNLNDIYKLIDIIQNETEFIKNDPKILLIGLLLSSLIYDQFKIDFFLKKLNLKFVQSLNLGPLIPQKLFQLKNYKSIWEENTESLCRESPYFENFFNIRSLESNFYTLYKEGNYLELKDLLSLHSLFLNSEWSVRLFNNILKEFLFKFWDLSNIIKILPLDLLSWDIIEGIDLKNIFGELIYIPNFTCIIDKIPIIPIEVVYQQRFLYYHLNFFINHAPSIRFPPPFINIKKKKKLSNFKDENFVCKFANDSYKILLKYLNNGKLKFFFINDPSIENLIIDVKPYIIEMYNLFMELINMIKLEPRFELEKNYYNNSIINILYLEYQILGIIILRSHIKIFTSLEKFIKVLETEKKINIISSYNSAIKAYKIRLNNLKKQEKIILNNELPKNLYNQLELYYDFLYDVLLKANLTL